MVRILGRRSRGENPFQPHSADPTAQPSGDGTASATAAAVLGQPLANAMAADVAANPGLLAIVDNTQSTVDPADVKAPQVSLYSMVADTSPSASSLFHVIAYGHDLFLDALMPAVKDNVAILATLSFLDGTVAYPLMLVGDAPRFGRQPVGEVTETVRNGETVKVDSMGHEVEQNGLTYAHIAGDWRRFMTSNTALRDRVKEQYVVLGAEALNWANPRVARTVRLNSVAITDGLDNGSTTTPEALSDYTGELESNGNFNALATFIGDLNREDFRHQLTQNILRNLIPLSELRGVQRDEWVNTFGPRVLPRGHELMRNEDLLRWWFFEQGLAAEQGHLFPVGTDPKAIRRAVGDMSMAAYQQVAGTPDEDE